MARWSAPRQAPATLKKKTNLAKEWVNMTSPLHMTQFTAAKLHQHDQTLQRPCMGMWHVDKRPSDCTFLFQVMYSSLRIARRKDDSLYCGWMRQRAVATMEAVRGPVTPVDVRNSAMLGVSRNGTGRLESRSPDGWKSKREKNHKGRKCKNHGLKMYPAWSTDLGDHTDNQSLRRSEYSSALFPSRFCASMLVCWYD